MGRIAEAFARAKEEQRAALVVYLCAGDPSLDATAKLAVRVAEAGADVIEIGMPFSDPTADGPTIQRASERALKSGTTLPGLLDAVRTIRRSTDVPLLLFGYYNPILAYGEARLVEDAHQAGIDGLLVVDLPPEQCVSLRSEAVQRDLDYVPLVAPTSHPGRVAKAAEVATAFIYYVSVTGVTGAGKVNFEQAVERAREVSETTHKPVAIGFGVSTPEQVATLSRSVQGVVVGSAIIRQIEAASNEDAALESVGRMVKELTAATRTRC